MSLSMSVENMSNPLPRKSLFEAISSITLNDVKKVITSKGPVVSNEEDILNALIAQRYKIRINGKEVALDTKFLKAVLAEAQNRPTLSYPHEREATREFYIETNLQKLLGLTLARVMGLSQVDEIETFSQKMYKSMFNDVTAHGVKDGINFVFKKQ